MTPNIAPVNVLQTQFIGSYLYEEYADDDDLAAFVANYNQMGQIYLDWFNTVNLPIYTGLSGPLLDWVAWGLYGLQRTSLTSPGSTASGPLNTELLNTAVLNSFSPPTTTFYSLSDDAFKRCLTWDFYKGDGKRFCARWLKRRIIRFLVGVNGTDPQPSQPGFTIGAETTSSLNVAINTTTNVVTVTIDQTRLGLQTTVTPGILPIFQIAFETMYLDLPIQYTYVVNIVSAVVAFATPTSVSSASPNSTQTTQPVTVTAYAGSGSYAYEWSWASGGAGISIDEPFSPTTTFTASSLSLGENVNGVAQCVVIDAITLEYAVVLVTVSITFYTLELLQENGNLIFALNGNPLLLG